MTANPAPDVIVVRPSSGGPSTVGAACAAELRSQGVDVAEILLPEHGWRAARALTAVLTSRPALRRARIVHVELGITAISTFWFVVWAGFWRRDLLAIAHDAPAFVRHPAAGIVPERAGLVDAFVHRVLVPVLDRPLTRWAQSRVGRFVVLSPAAKAAAEEAGMQPVVSVRHGGDDPISGPPPSTAGYVLLAGYLGPGKGLARLREAWSLVGGDMPLPLRIAGTAGRTHQTWFDAERAEFDRLASPPTWLGWLDDEQFKAAIAGAAIVVIPYEKSNPASGILTHAKVQGRAILATRVAAVIDEVDDGRDAVLVEPGDPEQLGIALLDLARDPARRDELGRRAAARAAHEHSWRRYTEDIYRGYELAAVSV